MSDTILTETHDCWPSLADSDTTGLPTARAPARPQVYTSHEVLAFETEALFRHDWVCVGRADGCRSGDWFTVDIVGEPTDVVRDKAGTVNCVSAVCQHRAMQVCEGSGNSSTFKCPYHHWNYGLDGRLLGAPAMERTIEFDKSENGLPPLRVELWEGFVFVNFDPSAPPLAPTLDSYTPLLANFDLEHAVCTGTFTLEGLPWNWKVMFENFNDGYHANRLHQFVQDFCPSSMTGVPGRVGRRARTSSSARPATPTSTAGSTPPTGRSCRCSRS